MTRRDNQDPSDELEQMAQEQFSDFEREDVDLGTRNRERCERVLELYAQGAVVTKEHHYFAALVVLYAGNTIAHYDLARRFAQTAANQGEGRAWWLIAAAWDRWLLEQQQPQRFGTQLIREHGRLSLGPIDPTITDQERAMYAVLPLWVQKQHLETLRRREEQR